MQLFPTHHGAPLPLRAIIAFTWMASVAFAFFLGALDERSRWHANMRATVREPTTTLREPFPLGGWVVATRYGKTFHLPWCPGVQGRDPSTLRWFASPAAAMRAGLRPAKNCRGLAPHTTP